MPLRQAARTPVGGQALPPPGISGPGGTLGGRRATGVRPGRYPVKLGDEQYLWILIFLEVGTMWWLRYIFRRRFGG